MTQKSHKELFSTNSDYHPVLNQKLKLLYEGGFKIQQCADLFLTRLEGLETAQAYNARKLSVSYIPYLSEFVTQFSSSLFSEQLEVKAPADAEDESTLGDDMTDDFYKKFIENCDGNGRSIHQFMQDVFDQSLYELKVYVGMDFPKALTPAQNLLEEEAMGLSKGYAYTIPYDNVIDWKVDPRTGKFIWLKIFEECFPDDDPLGVPTHYFMFKIWQVVNGKGGWTVWESQRMPLNKKYTQTTVYDLTEQGITSFPDIPIEAFCIPKGYHVGQQIGPICQEHYQRRSFLVANANKTCVALGVVNLGPEIGAPGDAVPMDLDVPMESRRLRAQLESDGWVVLRETDKVSIVEAKGEAHKFVSEELRHLVEQMMQTLRQMNMTASANVRALGRSAASKQVDQHGTSMLLSVYERKIKDFVKKYFTQLAAGRQEAIHWDIEGLSISTPVLDRKDLIEELTKLGVDVFKFPDLFKNKYLFRSATELLDNDLSDKEKLELQDKINESVEAGEFSAIDVAEATAGGNKMAKTTAQMEAEGPSDETMALGPMGHPQLPEGSHLQTGEHIDARTVFDQLSKDYKEKDIQFVKNMAWKGPYSVPLSSIDNSNMDNWASAQPEQQDHVDMFADKISKGEDVKPIILVNNPSNDNKMQLVDGHHRYLGALKAGQPIPAYIGEVSADSGPWDRLHSKQVGSNQQSSQQISQQVSKQVKESEK